MTGVYWAGLFAVVAVAAMIARQVFKAEIRKAEPALQARIGEAGDARFLWWLIGCGYLKLEDRRLLALAAIQHLWLICLICGVVYVVLWSAA